METITLGRTGLRATVAGLGCGGHSQLGVKAHGEDHGAGVARAAYGLGINFFDTSSVYGTEKALGKGLEGLPRESYILSSKFFYRNRDWRGMGPELLMEDLDQTLRNLNTDYLDIYHLHGVEAAEYEEVRDKYLPMLLKAKEQGKIRFSGVTELFGADTGHQMLQKALADDLYDVVMVGYNLLNPSARERVFPLTLQKDVGVLCMFAVRSALSNPAQLKVDLQRILDHGQGGGDLAATGEALDFLLQEGGAASVMEAAYRYCRHTPGVHVTLTGTGNVEHLRDNVRSINLPTLPDHILARLAALFGNVDCVSGQ